jgi:hypothetical protein
MSGRTQYFADMDFNIKTCILSIFSFVTLLCFYHTKIGPCVIMPRFMHLKKLTHFHETEVKVS